MRDRGPLVSVVVLADYGGKTSEDWDYLRATLGALSSQDIAEPYQVLLVDTAPEGQTTPADVRALVPGMRIVEGAETTPQLINRAVRETSGELVALLDGDCVPDPAWLRAAVEAMRAHAGVVAVSGRTTYPDRSFTSRTLGMLSRSYVDPGAAGPTRFITPYNAIVRREALVAHPLEDHSRALAARMQTEAIRLAGGGLRFEPRMRVTHRFDGWPMERRIRRRVGYRAIRARQLEPRLGHAWVVRLGILSVPPIVAARTLDSFRDCVRAGHHYGVRWFEIPAAFAMAVVVHLLEIGGMSAALSGHDEHTPPRCSS